ASVVGQEHITTTLKSAIVKGQLAHAYLFTGPRGVGKTTCARIFAKAINCQTPSAGGEACGECESCRAFDEGRSWGIHELDAASNNSVEDIRLLIEKVRIPPQVGRYSVYIIDEVHMLSSAAFNAFLKTLEEPPHYALFILATTEKHKILPTILSRCQSYDFRRIGVLDIVGYLEYVAQSEGVGYDAESLNIIAQKADGGMRDALSTFDRVVSYSGNNLSIEKTAESVGALDYNNYFRAIDLAQASDYGALLMIYDQTLRSGFEGGLFLSGLARHIRDLLVAKNPTTVPLLDVAGSLSDRYIAQSSALELEWILGAMQLINQSDASYRMATNRRLHTELALMKLCGLKKKDNGEQLIIADVVPLPAVVVTERVAVQPSVQPVAVQPTVQPVAVQPAVQPTIQQVVSTPIVETTIVETPKPTPTPTPEQTPTATKARRVSITGVKINNTPIPEETTTEIKPQTPNQTTPTHTPDQIEEILNLGWQKICDHWNKLQRPRIATALEVKTISQDQVTIQVGNETLSELLIENQIEIESSILEILGVRAHLIMELSKVEIQHKPVSPEQKLEFLQKKNPKLKKLVNALALSVNI
ncbi:MAG: DNA polymerase III subunit gamma/tau, partial [Rikenellaceae bacterium]